MMGANWSSIFIVGDRPSPPPGQLPYSLFTPVEIFAALALVLAAIGLYGVIAYTVARRTREIGLRVAMGAGRRDVFRLIVRHGMGPSLLGAVLGTLGGLGLSRLLSSLLYGVSASDPLTFSAVPVILMVVAFIACAVPAMAATRVDPIHALRYE